MAQNTSLFYERVFCESNDQGKSIFRFAILYRIKYGNKHNFIMIMFEGTY